MTLALIKPTVCSYQPDVSSILRIIKSSPGLFVSTILIQSTSRRAHILTNPLHLSSGCQTEAPLLETARSRGILQGARRKVLL